MLVDAGADVTCADHRGTTALSLAAQQGWAIAADYLLRRGANPNTKGMLPALLRHLLDSVPCV